MSKGDFKILSITARTTYKHNVYRGTVRLGSGNGPGPGPTTDPKGIPCVDDSQTVRRPRRKV